MAVEDELKALTANEKALFTKVQENDVNAVRYLLNEKDVRIDCLDKDGMTPLQHAAYRGHFNLCKLLLDRGADVNANYHTSKYTALMFSGLAGKIDIVTLLLEYGASTTAINSVSRNASQMAAFVGNHDVVSVINNFVPKEAIQQYTKLQGFETEPKLPPHIFQPFYQLIVKYNIHPVNVALYLQKNIELLKESKKVVNVLEILCEKEMRSTEPNELMALKYHHLAFIIKKCTKAYQETSDVKSLETLMKAWIKGRESDGFPILIEQLLRQGIREFPYLECMILQQLVRTLAPVAIGDEPSALSILLETISGQKNSTDNITSCATCGEPKAEKRCSACKSVQYCQQTCQKIHWATHKKQCARLKIERELQEAEEAKMEAENREANSSTDGKDGELCKKESGVETETAVAAEKGTREAEEARKLQESKEVKNTASTFAGKCTISDTSQ